LIGFDTFEKNVLRLLNLNDLQIFCDQS